MAILISVRKLIVELKPAYLEPHSLTFSDSFTGGGGVTLPLPIFRLKESEYVKYYY